MKTDSPGSILKKYLQAKQAEDRRYSLRRLAKEVELSPTHISHILNDKKPLTHTAAIGIITRLHMTPEWANMLYRATLRSDAYSPEVRRVLEQGALAAAQVGTTQVHLHPVANENFELLSKWYNLAILELTYCKDFKSNTRWMAQRLNISPEEVKISVAQLLKAGLLVKTVDGKLKKSKAKIEFSTPRSESAIRNFHESMIERARIALQNPKYAAFKKRTITGLTVPVSPKRFEEAEERIQKFLADMISLLSADGDCDEVYQCNIQFFPLTHQVKGVNYVD
jgi:uncharacterized protein (TIGR02147 family)